MKKISLLLLFLSFAFLGLAQKTPEKGMIKIVRLYEDAINAMGDTAQVNGKKKKEMLSELRDHCASVNIKVPMDLDSNRVDEYVTMMDYLKAIADSFPHGVQFAHRYDKVKSTDVEPYIKQNAYMSTLSLAKRIEATTIQSHEIDTFRVDTLASAEESKDTVDTDSISATVEVDTVKYTETVYDTTIVSKFYYLTFYFKWEKDKNVFKKPKIAAISMGNKKPEFLALDRIEQMWVEMPKPWRDIFKKEVSHLEDIANPYFLGYIKGIRKLDLSGSDIEDFSHLEICSGLQELDVSKTAFEDFNVLEPMKKLKILKANDCEVTTLEGIQHLHALEELDVSDIKAIEDVSPLRKLRKLYDLRLANNMIVDIQPLAQIQGLLHLDLSVNKIDHVKPLANLVNMEKLDISKNKIESIEPLKSMHNLIKLDIYSNNITDISPISSLKKITWLSIGYNQIDGISDIKHLNYMTHLNIAGIKLDNFSFLSNYPYLKELNCASTNLSNISPLMGLDRLTDVYLQYTELSSNQVQRFKKKHPNCNITYYR